MSDTEKPCGNTVAGETTPVLANHKRTYRGEQHNAPIGTTLRMRSLMSYSALRSYTGLGLMMYIVWHLTPVSALPLAPYPA